MGIGLCPTRASRAREPRYYIGWSYLKIASSFSTTPSGTYSYHFPFRSTWYNSDKDQCTIFATLTWRFLYSSGPTVYTLLIGAHTPPLFSTHSAQRQHSSPVNVIFHIGSLKSLFLCYANKGFCSNLEIRF